MVEGARLLDLQTSLSPLFLPHASSDPTNRAYPANAPNLDRVPPTGPVPRALPKFASGEVRRAPSYRGREKGEFIASGFAGSGKHSGLYEKVAEEAGGRPSQLEVEDVSALGEDAQGTEDEILEPEEDSLAGQMAMMRGCSVKKFQAESEDDGDGSDTDGDQKSDDSSDCD